MTVDPRIAQNGLHFMDADHGGVAFVLSHDQIKILVALLRFGSEERACLRNLVFFGKAWPQRYERTPLTAAQRAAYSRSLRRMEAHGLIRDTPAEVALTEAGAGLARWLTGEWDGWKVYARNFAADWSAELTAPPATAEDRAAELARLEAAIRGQR